MKGLVFTKLNHVELKEVPKPQITCDTDVIIKVTLTTLCGSDIHLVQGHIPTTPGYVLGHEYVGVVEEVGSKVKKFKPGDRVIGPAAPYCGQCENCKAGNIAQCMNGGVHGSGKEMGNIAGTHAEFTKVPHGDVNLIKVPDKLKDEQVLFVGDILSTGYFGVDKCNIVPGDTVVIFGAGPVGLNAVKAATLFSPKRIIVVGRKNQFRLEMAKQMGATDIIRSDSENVVEKIFELTGGKGADAVIEASGSEAALKDALRCASIGGRVTLIGLFPGEVQIPISEVFMKNLKIEMGLGYLGHMNRLMALIENGKIDLTALITHQMKLEEVEKAYEIFQNDSKAIKIAIRP